MVNDEFYSKEAVEYAKKRLDYELSYSNGLNFTDEQYKWIKEHIYFTARKSYSVGFENGSKKN